MMVWSFQAKIRLGVHMLGTYDIECYLWSVQKNIFRHVEQPCYPATGVQKLCVSPQKKSWEDDPGLKYTL